MRPGPFSNPASAPLADSSSSAPTGRKVGSPGRESGVNKPPSDPSPGRGERHSSQLLNSRTLTRFPTLRTALFRAPQIVSAFHAQSELGTFASAVNTCSSDAQRNREQQDQQPVWERNCLGAVCDSARRDRAVIPSEWPVGVPIPPKLPSLTSRISEKSPHLLNAILHASLVLPRIGGDIPRLLDGWPTRVIRYADVDHAEY